ncbi:MAG: DNA translocase FtsK 4TM domain-containing protein [Deltaproteobacteria bacterium]|nr:DNA translocase FtsK 4TM domain-containing protein [Deltaproteobacteria bacterium]
MTNSIDGGLKGRGVRQEIAGIVFLALGMYSAVCLMSGISGSRLGGVVGEYVARALFYSFGYSSYIIPFFLVFVAFKLLLRRILVISLTAPLGLGILLFASSALLGTISPAGKAGGKAGAFIGAPLAELTGTTGAAIILLGIILAALLAITGVRLRKRNGDKEKKEPPTDTNIDGFQQ